MQFVCDTAERKTWFRIETEAEAEHEATVMNHAVAKHFKRERDTAAQTFKPAGRYGFEQNIGLEAHIQREMSWFLTLRDSEGDSLVTAMLPPENRADPGFEVIIVGLGNSDPYPEHKAAIEALGRHLGRSLERGHCYPYRR